MNEISTALKTLTDRITVKLEIGEKHFNVFLCIALCALVIYPLLYVRDLLGICLPSLRS